MNQKTITLNAALYIVSTPIGNARDITLRALDVLSCADILVAEDTRTLRRLLDIHGITLNSRRILAYHDHSSERDRSKIVDLVAAGSSVAYASEAGTPLIADPGYKLVQDIQSRGLNVTAVPGANAVTTALTLAGHPTDAFSFVGFLPPTQAARIAALKEILARNTTTVVYESPKRIAAFCKDLVEVAGPDHPLSICRELTKRFEEILKGTVSELLAKIETTPLKGEIVVVIGAGKRTDNSHDIKAALVEALLTMRVKDAAESVSGAYGLPKREVYQMALALKNKT